MKRQLTTSNENVEVDAMIFPSLYQLTAGLPRKELKLMVSEAMMCEEALENEIKQLEAALESPPDSEAGKNIQFMLDSEITPPDRFFTVSSLLGRLRDDLATPLPPNSIIPEMRARTGLVPPPPKKKKKENISADAPADAGDGIDTEAVSTSSSLEKQKKVLSLAQNPEYTREHSEPTALMSLWKKISSHRSSIVFRRPVNPKEAPGYTDRIAFPMDLSLIRKMIMARQIISYSDLHQRLGLICHNCVKYNGRESDYGVVTRDFESNVDEMVVNAVLAAAADPQQTSSLETTAQPTGETTTVPTLAEGSQRSGDVPKSNEERPTTGTSSVKLNSEPIGDLGLNAKDSQSNVAVASVTPKENP